MNSTEQLTLKAVHSNPRAMAFIRCRKLPERRVHPEPACVPISCLWLDRTFHAWWWHRRQSVSSRVLNLVVGRRRRLPSFWVEKSHHPLTSLTIAERGRSHLCFASLWTKSLSAGDVFGHLAGSFTFGRAKLLDCMVNSGLRSRN